MNPYEILARALTRANDSWAQGERQLLHELALHRCGRMRAEQAKQRYYILWSEAIVPRSPAQRYISRRLLCQAAEAA